MIFREFMAKYFFPIHVEDGEHKPVTIEYYSSLLPRLLSTFGDLEIDHITSLDIEKFYISLRREKLSPTTVQHYEKALRLMFSFAKRHNLTCNSPMDNVKAVRLPKHKVDFLSADEARHFLSVLDEAPIMWRCFMLILILCGLRRGEAVGLQWHDIDFRNMSLNIQRSVTYSRHAGIVIGTPKSESSIRVLPIPPIIFEC